MTSSKLNQIFIKTKNVPSLKRLITEICIEKRKPILNNSNSY